MTQLINILECLQASDVPMIDVRSPGEFQKGHIPGAINIPAFNDDERAEIGTLYKRAGRKKAVVRGLEIVGANASAMLESISKAGLPNDCFVHCWRGGMRSEGFAWLLHGCEYRPKRVIGGYKAFRTAAHDSFAEPQRVIILAGASGAGKTQLLGTLDAHGQQVIDLEKLANHRGSAFGGIGQPPQPTVEQFENNLFLEWRELDRNRPVWIECESKAIGRVQVPKPVWDQMASAPAVFVDVNTDARVDFLVGEYGQLPKDELVAAIKRIEKRLGGADLKFAIAAIQRDDIRSFAETALRFYDKSYTKALVKRPFHPMETVHTERAGHVDSLEEMAAIADRLTSQKHSAV